MIKIKEGTNDFALAFNLSPERTEELEKEWRPIMKEYHRTYIESGKFVKAGKEIPEELNLRSDYVLMEFTKTAKTDDEQAYAIFQAGRKIEEFENIYGRGPNPLTALKEMFKGLNF